MVKTPPNVISKTPELLNNSTQTFQHPYFQRPTRLRTFSAFWTTVVPSFRYLNHVYTMVLTAYGRIPFRDVSDSARNLLPLDYPTAYQAAAYDGIRPGPFGEKIPVRLPQEFLHATNMRAHKTPMGNTFTVEGDTPISARQFWSNLVDQSARNESTTWRELHLQLLPGVMDCVKKGKERKPTEHTMKGQWDHEVSCATYNLMVEFLQPKFTQNHLYAVVNDFLLRCNAHKRDGYQVNFKLEAAVSHVIYDMCPTYRSTKAADSMAMLPQPVLSLVCPMFADFVEKLHPTALKYYHPSEAVVEGCIWHMQRIGIPDPTHLTDVILDSNESYATEVTIVANPADYPLPAGTTTTGLGQEGVDYNVQAGYTPAATFTIDDMDYPTLERRMQEFELRCRAYRREKRSYYTVFATRGYPVTDYRQDDLAL